MLKIGIVTGSATAESLDLVTDAERLGVDSAWIPEAWMFDGLTPAAYLAGRTETMRLGTACVQLGSRSPALLAMSALSLQAMSNGRFILGMGTSGPGRLGLRRGRALLICRYPCRVAPLVTKPFHLGVVLTWILGWPQIVPLPTAVHCKGCT